MERNTTPNIDISNFQGLFTKTNPEILDPTQLRECKNVDFFREYGALAKSRGSGNVLSSVYTESGVAKAIPWIGFYKFQDLNGAIIRQRLISAGTTIQQVSQAGALTELATGEPDNLFRASDQLSRFMYITSQDPYRIGNKGTPRRWDGEKLSKWGIEAPGRFETVRENFEDASALTATNCSASDDAVTAWSGNSTQLVKTSTTAKEFSVEIQNIATPFAPNEVIDDRLEVAFYLTREDYRKLNTAAPTGAAPRTSDDNGAAVSIYLGCDASHTWVIGAGENFSRYDFRVGSLFPGWNFISVDYDTFPTGDFGVTEGTITGVTVKSMRFEVLTTNITDIITCNFDHFTTLDQGTPTPAPTTATNTGSVFNYSTSAKWSYKVTYVNENGVESNAGPESIDADLTVAGSDVITTEMHDFDDATDWTAGTDVVLADDPTNQTTPTNGMKITKTSGTVVDADADHDGSLTLNFEDGISADQFTLDVFVATQDTHDVISAFEIWLGDGSGAVMTNYKRWTVAPDDLSVGEFVTLTFDLTSPDEVQGLPNMASISNIKIRIVTNLLADTFSGVDFVTVDNLELLRVNNYATIELTALPVSSDPSVVKRRIYRTVAGGAEHLFLASVNNNVQTTYSDSTADAGLGVVTPPEAGLRFDSSPPPNGAMFKVWKRTGFMAGDPLNPTILYFSEFDEVDKWPLINAFEFDEPITGLFRSNMGMVVTTETGLWRVFGDNPDYVIDRVRDKTGAVGHRAVGEVRQEGWAIDRDGLRLFDLRDTIKASEVIRDRIDAFDKANLEFTHSKFSRIHNHINWFTQDSSGNYTDNYLYHFALDDVRSGWWSQLVLPSNLDIRYTEEIEDDNGDFHLWGGGDDGMVYELFKETADNWVNSVGAESSVDFEVQSRWIRPGQTGMEGELATGRVVPYLVELRVHEKNGLASTWTVTIETNGAPSETDTALDSQAVTFAFPANVGLLRIPIPNLTGAEYMRFKITNTDTDVDVRLYGIRIYYHVRPGQFSVTGAVPGQ